MPFAAEDLEIARTIFNAIVEGQPNRALGLDAVIRWPASAWLAFADVMRTAGFEFRNPRHLAALQSLIDKACDA